MEGEYEKIREQALHAALEAEPQEATVRSAERNQPDAAEPEGAEQSVEAQKATDAEQSVEVEPEKPKKAKAAKKAEDASLGDPGRQKPKEKPPRMICEGCGRSYSIHTKRHVCKAPKGFEKKENVPGGGGRSASPSLSLAPGGRSPPPSRPSLPEPVPPPMPVDLQRQITLADVTQFLFAESKARREKRRDDLLSKMF